MIDEKAPERNKKEKIYNVLSKVVESTTNSVPVLGPLSYYTISKLTNLFKDPFEKRRN